MILPFNFARPCTPLEILTAFSVSEMRLRRRTMADTPLFEATSRPFWFLHKAFNDFFGYLAKNTSALKNAGWRQHSATFFNCKCKPLFHSGGKIGRVEGVRNVAWAAG